MNDNIIPQSVLNLTPDDPTVTLPPFLHMSNWYMYAGETIQCWYGGFDTKDECRDKYLEFSNWLAAMDAN